MKVIHDKQITKVDVLDDGTRTLTIFDKEDSETHVLLTTHNIPKHIDQTFTFGIGTDKMIQITRKELCYHVEIGPLPNIKVDLDELSGGEYK